VLANKAPERAKEWKKVLEKTLGSEESLTFELGDEPEDLIEDVVESITADLELAAEEEDGTTSEGSEMEID